VKARDNIVVASEKFYHKHLFESSGWVLPLSPRDYSQQKVIRIITNIVKCSDMKIKMVVDGVSITVLKILSFIRGSTVSSSACCRRMKS